MIRTAYKALGIATFLLACTGTKNVQCATDEDCNLSGGGICTLVTTGNRWCSYPDPQCPGGYRFSDQAVGDDLEGVCVAQVPGKALWVSRLGSSGGDIGNGITIDSDDNIVAVGSFSQTIAELGLSSSGATDIYVVKMEGSTGNVLWVKQYGGTMVDAGIAVTVDSSKNIYVAASFEGTVDFGNGPLLGGIDGAAVVLKLDSEGGFKWAQRVGGARNVHAIATNGDAVVVAGQYNGSLTTDTQTFMSVDGSPDMFILRLMTTSGEIAWAKSFGGGFLDRASGIAIDSSNNIVVTGYFERTVSFTGGTITAAGTGEDGDGFLLKLDANGAYLLSKRFGGVSVDEGAALAVDSFNNIFIVGSFRETASLGCSEDLVASSPSQADVLLVKYTQAGACLWAIGFGGTGSIRSGASISVNRVGDIAASGMFCGSITLGDSVLTSASECNRGVDAFGVRLRGEDGVPLSSVRAGSAMYLDSRGIVQSSDGRYFMTGRFSGFAELGNQTLTSVGDVDAFVAGFDRL